MFYVLHNGTALLNTNNLIGMAWQSENRKCFFLVGCNLTNLAPLKIDTLLNWLAFIGYCLLDKTRLLSLTIHIVNSFLCTAGLI